MIGGIAMDAFKWISKELHHYQHEERAAIERIKISEALLAQAKTELASAKQALAGARGGITEFTWQMKHLEEHGRLP
jgi:hypothetical protein